MNAFRLSRRLAPIQPECYDEAPIACHDHPNVCQSEVVYAEPSSNLDSCSNPETMAKMVEAQTKQTGMILDYSRDTMELLSASLSESKEFTIDKITQLINSKCKTPVVINTGNNCCGQPKCDCKQLQPVCDDSCNDGCDDPCDDGCDDPCDDRCDTPIIKNNNCDKSMLRQTISVFDIFNKLTDSKVLVGSELYKDNCYQMIKKSATSVTIKELGSMLSGSPYDLSNIVNAAPPIPFDPSSLADGTFILYNPTTLKLEIGSICDKVNKCLTTGLTDFTGANNYQIKVGGTTTQPTVNLVPYVAPIIPVQKIYEAGSLIDLVPDSINPNLIVVNTDLSEAVISTTLIPTTVGIIGSDNKSYTPAQLGIVAPTQTKLISGDTTLVTGTGSTATPYKVEVAKSTDSGNVIVNGTDGKLFANSYFTDTNTVLINYFKLPNDISSLELRLSPTPKYKVTSVLFNVFIPVTADTTYNLMKSGEVVLSGTILAGTSSILVTPISPISHLNLQVIAIQFVSGPNPENHLEVQRAGYYEL